VRAGPEEVEEHLGLAVAVEVGERDRAAAREEPGRLRVEAAARGSPKPGVEPRRAVSPDLQALLREAERWAVVGVGEDGLNRAGLGSLDMRPRSRGGGRHEDGAERDGKR
jgi:hypothetical protein